MDTFPQNLPLICVTVSEKTRFMDGWTTDAHATALALLTESSRANKDQQIQMRSKYHTQTCKLTLIYQNSHCNFGAFLAMHRSLYDPYTLYSGC